MSNLRKDFRVFVVLSAWSFTSKVVWAPKLVVGSPSRT